MPTCFVPGCKSGYGGKLTGKHYFTPPKDKDEFCKWVKAITRKDRPLSRSSSICDCHFSKDLIIKVDKFVVNGNIVELPRQKWKLKSGAVPHIFPNLPKYLSVPFKSRKRDNRQKEECTNKRKRKSEDLPVTSTSDISEIRGDPDDKHQTRDDDNKDAVNVIRRKTNVSTDNCTVAHERHSKHAKSGVQETEDSFQFVSCQTGIKEEYEEEEEEEDDYYYYYDDDDDGGGGGGVEDSIDYSCDYIKNENESKSEEDNVTVKCGDTLEEEMSQINVAIKEEVDFTEEDMDENCMGAFSQNIKYEPYDNEDKSLDVSSVSNSCTSDLSSGK